MAVKLEVTFDVGVKIVGNGSPSIEEQIVIVCKPFANGTSYNGENTPTYTEQNSPLLQDGTNTFNASITKQNTTFNNVLVFSPSLVEEVNGKLKCTVPEEMNEAIRFIEDFHYFYEHVEGGQEIKRKDTDPSISKKTKKSSATSTNSINHDDDEDGDINTNNEFAFEILSSSINATGDKITYNFTDTRNLQLYKEDNNGNWSDVVSNLELQTQAVNTFLNLTFTDDSLYHTDSTQANPVAFGLANGIDIQQNAKQIILNVDPNQGKLVGTSAQNSINLLTETGTNIVAKDQIKLKLEIADNYTFTNNINNPTIDARAEPSDAKDGYIVLDLYKNNDNNAPLIENLTEYNTTADSGTLRHGQDTNSDLTQINHPVTGGFNISAGNVYTQDALPDVTFAFEDANNKAIEVEGGANTHLIVENRTGENDVIKLRLDRFPRHGIEYTLSYTHKLNKISGIFNDDGHGVIDTENTGIVLTNNLQEVTGTVGTFKVYYPPQKPDNWNNPSGSFNEDDDPYEDYSAYYYVDITFKRGNTPALITAKYNDDPETYQLQAGHNIHHGLILTKDNTLATPNDPHDGKVDEEITRTTIRDNNDDVVFLNNTSFGTKLRIELPVAIGDGSNKYPYDTDATDLKLTAINFADLDSKSRLDLIDREKLENGSSTNPLSYYYINVMDSLGNVVSPIKNEALQTDNDWGKATDSNNNKISPEIEKAEYQAQYDQGTQTWIKKVVMTFKHDLKEDTPGNITTLFNNEIAIDNDGDTIQQTNPPVITQNNNEVSIKVQDPVAGSNDGTLTYNSVDNGDVSVEYTQGTTDTNTIFNWLGFKIASFNETVVLASNMSSLIPTISSISFGNITNQGGPPATSFSGDLTWSLDSGSTNGLTYKVEYSTSSDFATIEGNLNQAHTGGNNFPVDQTAQITGLGFNENYYFRVTPTNFEDGTALSTTTAFSQVGPAGELQNFNVVSSSGPTVVASWTKPLNVTQYKIEYSSDNGTSWTANSGLGSGDGFIETTNGNVTTISYSFSGNQALIAATEYDFRASYSTTTNTGANTVYTFGPFANNMPVENIVTYPPQVTGLSVTENTLSDTEFELSWDAITVGTQLDGYTVEQSADAGASWDDLTPDGPITDTNLNIQELSSETSYQFRVKASNSAGSGPYSTTLTVTTLESAPVISIDADVSTPTNDTTPSFTLSSDKAGTISITSPSGISLSSSTVGIGNTTFTFNTLNEDTYNVTVAVTNNDGLVSDAATLAEFVIDTTAPNLLAGSPPQVENNGTSITLYFDEDLDSTLTPSITVTGDTLGTATATAAFSSSNNGTDDVITLSGFGTIYSGETVNLSYTSGVKDLAGNEWNPLSTDLQGIQNSSTQVDSTGPAASNYTWYYKKDGETQWVGEPTGNDEVYIKEGDHIKLEFDVDEPTGFTTSNEGATFGGTNADDTPTVSISGNAGDGYVVTMEYTIADNDDGTAVFSVTLTDNSPNTNQTIVSQTHSASIIVDTTAPNLSTTTTPEVTSSDSNKIVLTFDESLEDGSSLESGFSISFTNVAGDTVSITGASLDTNDDKVLILSLSDNIYSTDAGTFSISYDSTLGNIADLAGNGWDPTPSTITVTNNSSETYTPPDTLGPTIGTFSYSVANVALPTIPGTTTSKLSLNPGQSVTVTLSVDITDDTSASGDITVTIADANNWTASNPFNNNNTFQWNRTFTNSATGNNGTTTTITGTTVTATDEAGNSTTSSSTGDITVDEYVYEDPVIGANGNTSFDIELLSGSDAKPGNVNFVLKYQLNGTLTVRRDIEFGFEFGTDNSFNTGSKTLTYYESVSEGTNAAATISNSEWTDNKYEIQAYSGNLGDAGDSYNNNNGIGLGEKFVRTNIYYTNNDGNNTIHIIYVSDGVTQSSYGSLVRADKPWYCVLDVSGNNNNYWNDPFNVGNDFNKIVNHFTLEKHTNHVKENPRTFDVIKGYYDSTGNEIGVKFKLPQYRFVPDISYNRVIIDPTSQQFGDEDWGVYNNSATITSTGNTTNWMYRDDIRKKIGILEPEIKGYYIKGKEKNSANDYDIILQPNKFGTWKDEDEDGNNYYDDEADVNNALYGKSVDISRDGKIAIVGAPNESWTQGNDSGTGVVRVYEVASNGSLTQKGPDIRQPSSTRFGQQVVINGDGSRIAISNPGDYDATTPTTRGFIFIYEYDTTQSEWTSMITDQGVTVAISLLDLDNNYSSHSTDGDGFGLSMVMSDDGNNILIGAPYGLNRKGYIGMIKYTEPTTGPNAGVFPGEGEGGIGNFIQGLTDWSILGVIDGLNAETPTYDGDKFGFSVDMVKSSADYIAVGAPGDKSVSIFRGDKYQHVFTANDNLYGDIAANVSGHTDATYTGVTTTTGTDQYGSGLTLNITVNGGVVSAVVVNSVGSGYAQYDNIIVAADAIGGTVGGDEFRITVPEANLYSYKRRCSPDGAESGGDKTIGRTDSGDKDVGYSIKINNTWAAGSDGTTAGDVTSVDFGYAIGYTRDENGIHTIVVGAPEENYRNNSGNDEKGRIRIFVWDEDYSNSVYQWTSDKDKGGYGDNNSSYRDFNKGSSIAIERNAKFFMVQRYGYAHGNSNQNGRVKIFYKVPRWIDAPTSGLWADDGDRSRWSNNGERELGHIRDGDGSGDDFGASIAISEGGEKIIIGAPYSTSSNEKGYVTIHLPNSKYTNTTESATESNYTFTNQEKALFPVQQDNAPRGYIYDDRSVPTNSSKFGNLRKYEFIYMFNEWEIKGTNDSNYPYTNITDISGREMDWAVTAVSEYSRKLNGDELEASSNDHFWSDSGTLGDYGDGNYSVDNDLDDWIPRIPYDPQNQLTALSDPIKSGGTNAITTNSDYGHYSNATVDDDNASVTIQIDGGSWITGKTFFKPNNDATSDYSNPSHQFFKTKSVVTMDVSGETNAFDENNDDYKSFELIYNSNTNAGDPNANLFHPAVRNEVDGLKNNNYYEYYYHIVNTLCKTDLSGARYPNSDTEYGSILTPPGNPSVEYTNSNPPILKILPASFDGNATKPTYLTKGFGPGTLEDELRYSIGWHINDWWTKNTYETLTYAGNVTRDSYTDLLGNAEGAGNSVSNTTQYVDFGRAFASNLDGDIIAVGGGSWDGKITNASTISGAQANLDQFPSEMDGINRARNGFVKVYKYDYSNNTWSQMGTTIYGNDGTLEKGVENDTNNNGDDTRIKHDTGYALDITQDGSILVIGERAAGMTEITNSNTNNDIEIYKGKIRVFKFIEDVNGNKDWAQIGEDIEGDSGKPNGQFGHSVACLKYKRTFTDAGDLDFIRVCAGAPNAAVGGTKRGYVGVYNLNNNLSDKEWTVTVNNNGKYVFTNSNDNTDTYTAQSGSDLPITYGEKHIFDYSAVTGHPLGFGFQADGANNSAISDGDYNALKIERDTDNHKVTLTLKQTHKKDAANPYGNTDRIQGILYYFCTNHNGMGSQFDIENCWVGGTGISNNNSAPQTESNGNGPLQFGIGVAMGFDDTADDDEKLVMTVSSGGEPAAGGATADWLIAPGQVDAFRYDYDNGTWIAYGNANSTAATTTSPVYGGGDFDDNTSHGTSGNLARSMSLTKDGNYMAVGVAGKDYTPNGGTSQSNVGAVVLFKRNLNDVGSSNSWNKVGEITGEQHGNNLNNTQLTDRNFGKNVSITRLGTDIFIAATTSKTESDDEAGEVLIYKYDETNNADFTWTGANTNIEKVKNSIVSNGSDLDFGTPDITLTDSQSGSDRRVVITNRGDTVIFGGPERGPSTPGNANDLTQYGSLSVWNSGIYFKKLEGATTTSTDENEMTYQWTGETNTFPGNLQVTFKNSGTNGHDSSFDYTPLDSTNIRTSISNRKTANDDWQLGPSTIIDSGT